MVSMQRKRLSIEGPVGNIDAYLEGPTTANKVVVVCHPHPLHGGTMDNKVVTTIARLFHSLGVASIRFNFRGVGSSEGEHDSAVGEIDDALSVVAYAKKTGLQVAAIAGFSFGGFIAYRVAQEIQSELSATVLVAPAINKYQQEPASSRFSTPLIVAQGLADDVIEAEGVEQWLQGVSGPTHYLTFADAGHFFHGQLVGLKSALAESLMEYFDGSS